ncbi:MAG: family intrarane metalloprotease protein [Labilithrix sp.]|nr:family intrarane metalloprotease protein [Labilithrix sp.]
MLDALRQTKALAVLTLRYWARAGVPNRLRKDQGRRTSGALLRLAFLVLMTNWGYRIGTGCVRVDYEHRGNATAWMLVGLGSLAVTWGAMGRGPSMREPQSVLRAPLLDGLPLREGSRVMIGLLERLILYALATAALLAIVPAATPGALLLGVALPTAGLLVGDGGMRVLRTFVSPLQMGRLGTAVMVLQFPSFMIVGGAPILAKLPRASSLVQPLVAPGFALTMHGVVLGPVLVSLGVASAAMVAIRLAERVGYDRIDIVPVKAIASAPTRDLDLVRIEAVLAAREPGGRWLMRGAFFYTSATSVGLLALSRLSKQFPAESAAALVRTLGYVAVFSGFAVVQARAGRLVQRDAGARPMLSPLPIAPRDLLRGKTRALMVQALVVVLPYFVLLAMPGDLALHLEVAWRGSAAASALVFAAAAAVAVAFLTQGLGGTKVLGGSFGIETTLVAMPLLAVAAAPYAWSALVSVISIAMLAYEARRSALRCLRWIDDDAEHEGETVVWRALLVFASFQAAQTLMRRLLSFAPIDENLQSAAAYGLAALTLLGLTLYGRRGLPRMLAFPRARALLWLLAALAGGALTGAANVGYRFGLRALGVELGPPVTDGELRLVIVGLTVVLAPIVEEIFFRGWLQDVIESELPAARRWLAPLLGAFAFAALRAPLSFAPTLLLGVVCGVFFARTRAVLPCILGHAAYFAVTLAARYFLAAP